MKSRDEEYIHSTFLCGELDMEVIAVVDSLDSVRFHP